MVAPKSIQVPTKKITNNKGQRINVPAHFICPVSHSLMVHPLMNRDGVNFERSVIIEWIQDNGTCPLSGKPMKPSQLISNKGLEQKINFWREQNGFCSTAQCDDDSLGSDDFSVRDVAIFSVSKSKAAELLSRSSAMSVATTISGMSNDDDSHNSEEVFRNVRTRPTMLKRILAKATA